MNEQTKPRRFHIHNQNNNSKNKRNQSRESSFTDQRRGTAEGGADVPGGAAVMAGTVAPVVVVVAMLANRAGTAIPVDGPVGGVKNVEIAGNDG